MARNAILGTYTGQIHRATSLRSMFRVGHSFLNINMSYRQCSCGSTETLGHLILRCSLSLHHRNLLRITLKLSCSTKNSIISHITLLSLIKLIHILLFGHPELSFKPRIVIFAALSRFFKRSERFKSVVW